MYIQYIYIYNIIQDAIYIYIYIYIIIYISMYIYIPAQLLIYMTRSEHNYQNYLQQHYSWLAANFVISFQYPNLYSNKDGG